MDKTDQNIIVDLNIKNIINPCITSYGTNKLIEMLNYTLFDENLLMRRQEILLELLKNQEKVANLTKILYSIKEKEVHLNEIINSRELIEGTYFEYNFLNWSHILTLYNNFKSYFAIVVIIVYLLIYMIYKYSGSNINLTNFFTVIYNGYVNMSNQMLNNIIKNQSITFNLAKIFAITYIIYQAYTISSTALSCWSHNKKLKQIKQNYNLTIELIKDIEELYDTDTILKYEKRIIGDNLDNLDDNFCENKKIGDILIACKNIDNYLNDFRRIVQYVGTIDAFITLSKMLGNGYTLPIYVNDEKPYVNIENLYNPTINYETEVINNDFQIDNQIMIITGPNKSGKSTYMQSVLLAILLSQTWGISPCSKIILTPFKKIFLSQSNKSFNESVGKYHKILNITKETDGFVFVGIDNLLSNTYTKEGIACSYAITDQLSKAPNILSIITTQYDKICTQNIDNGYNVATYKKFEAIYDTTKSKYIFPYNLKDGISNQSIAIHLLEEKGFNQVLIRNALLKLRTL